MLRITQAILLFSLAPFLLANSHFVNWSDKTLCRLAKDSGSEEYRLAAIDRGLTCSPVNTLIATPKIKIEPEDWITILAASDVSEDTVRNVRQFDGALDANELKILGISTNRCIAKPHKRTGSRLAATWRQEISCPAEVFVTSDIGNGTKAKIEITLGAVAAEWGNYGPVEYWVMGSDKAAAEELIKKYCLRRAKNKNMDFGKCSDRETRAANHGLLSYHKLGAKALSTKKWVFSAGFNGGPEWGILRFSSSLPLGLENKLGAPAAKDQKQIMHEYFHGVQNAHIRALNHQKRKALEGPVWFKEGAAEYMASVTYPKLVLEKKIDHIKNVNWEYDFKKEMRNKLREAKLVNDKHNCIPQMTNMDYSSSCRRFFYDGGTWAIAYLVSQTNENVLLKDFYPNLEKLGWEATFQKTFQKTSDAFYLEFEDFLKKQLSEVMLILPKH